MKTIITLIAMLGITLSAYAQVIIGQDIDGEAPGDKSGRSVSMPDANTVAIGAIYNEGNGIRSGHVRIYTWNGSAWLQKGGDIDGDAASDLSGWSVSMPDANTVAVGAPFNKENKFNGGQVSVYGWDGFEWVQKGVDIYGEAVWDQSGWSISMPDTNTIAIGAIRKSGNVSKAGHVRVFSWNGNEWIQKGNSLIGKKSGDKFGFSVSMSDANTVAIGAPMNGIYAGYVTVYSWDGSAWIQKGSDIEGEEGDESGRSVSMPDANTVAIGAPLILGNVGSAGHVRVYNWDGSAWVQKGQDILGKGGYDQSGYAVSMPDANTVAIGAPYYDIKLGGKGLVRIYKWIGNTWTQIGHDIDGESNVDRSGWSVSMPDANTVAIGSEFNDGNGLGSGHVRVYTLSTVGIIDNSFSDKFTIYPNPTGGHLFINFDIMQEELNASLYTLDGKLLDNRKGTNTTNFSFEITAPSGIYLVKISNKKQKATVRIVKE